MGTYSTDSITKYIIFFEIIKKRKAKYPFAIFNTDKENGPGIRWFIHKIIYFCLIRLVSKDLGILL